MLLTIQESVAAFVAKYGLELILVGSAISLALIVVIVWTIFRKRGEADRAEGPKPDLVGLSAAHHPTREQVLDALVEFDAYPTFARILAEVFNHFSMEYLNSYGELGASFARLVDFPKGAQGLSPTQKAAMVTIVRVLMSSDFIRNKCGDTVEDNFERFMQEVAETP